MAVPDDDHDRRKCRVAGEWLLCIEFLAASLIARKDLVTAAEGDLLREIYLSFR